MNGPIDDNNQPRTSGGEWDGFRERFWNLGQVILWEATGNRDFVDQSSDDNGRLGEDYGLAAAAVILEEHVAESVRKDVADDIRRRCADGKLIALAGDEPIPAAKWTSLNIEFDRVGRPVVRWHNNTRAYRNIRFESHELLHKAPKLASTSRRRQFPKDPPSARALGHCWRVLRAAFGADGPPESMTIREIMNRAHNKRASIPDYGRGLSESTIRRLLRG
jgi:hypothetical protein